MLLVYGRRHKWHTPCSSYICKFYCSLYFVCYRKSLHYAMPNWVVLQWFKYVLPVHLSVWKKTRLPFLVWKVFHVRFLTNLCSCTVGSYASLSACLSVSILKFKNHSLKGFVDKNLKFYHVIYCHIWWCETLAGGLTSMSGCFISFPIALNLSAASAPFICVWRSDLLQSIDSKPAKSSFVILCEWN